MFTFPLALAIIGNFSNMLVILVNGGMPVAGISNAHKAVFLTFPPAERMALPLSDSTRFAFLGDVLPGQYSIGDVFMGMSLLAYAVIVVVWVARSRKRKLIAAY